MLQPGPDTCIWEVGVGDGPGFPLKPPPLVLMKANFLPQENWSCSVISCVLGKVAEPCGTSVLPPLKWE